MFVWLLMSLTIDKHFIGPTNVNVGALVFTSAESCLDNKNRVEKELSSKHDMVQVFCEKQEVSQ